MSKQAEVQVRKRIQASGEPCFIEQLCLDSIQITSFTSTIRKMLEGCTNLEYLTLNNCKLQKLDNFPKLQNLIVLQLSDNRLTGEDFQQLKKTPLVNFLTLDSNLIANTSNLRHLAALSELEILQVHDNPLTSNQDYRRDVFTVLPGVKAVDCQDRLGSKVKEEDPSEYLSLKGPNSRMDLTSLLDSDQPFGGNNNQIFSINDVHPSTCPDYIENGKNGRQTDSSPRSPRANNRRNQRFPLDIFTIRTKPVEDDDSEEFDSIFPTFMKKQKRQQE